MGEITLILGGARSGKSTFAEELALNQKEHVTYLATADCRDVEMKKRIEIHQSRRPAEWGTWEGEPRDLPRAAASASGLLLLDCLTMWLTRLFLSFPESEGEDEAAWFAREGEIASLVRELCGSVGDGASLIIRDLQGRMNQLCAGYAKNVALVVAGCPLWIKGGGPA